MKGSEDVSRSVPALSGGSYRAASSGSWESTSPEYSSAADHSNSGSTAAAEAGQGSLGFGDTRYTDIRRPSAATRLDSIGEDEVFESSAAVYAVQTNVSSRVAARSVLGSTGRSLSKDSSSSSLGYSLGSESSECAYSPTSPTAVRSFGDDDGIYKVVNPSQYVLNVASSPNTPSVRNGVVAPALGGADKYVHGGYSVINSSVCDNAAPAASSLGKYSVTGPVHRLDTPGYSVVGQAVTSIFSKPHSGYDAGNSATDSYRSLMPRYSSPVTTFVLSSQEVSSGNSAVCKTSTTTNTRAQQFPAETKSVAKPLVNISAASQSVGTQRSYGGNPASKSESYADAYSGVFFTGISLPNNNSFVSRASTSESRPPTLTPGKSADLLSNPNNNNNVSASHNEIAADNADRFIKPLPGYNSNSNSNTLSSSTTPRSTSSGYGTASSKLSASSESSPGGDGSGSLSKELDLELVRLEILVDSLQEMEEELNFNEQQKMKEKEEVEEGGVGECDVWEYQSSEDGDLLSSANEVGSQTINVNNYLFQVLGFNRVPPVAGRKLNMTQDIRRLAESKLARTFFISPAGNLCFHGSCSYYCDSGHPICGHPDMLEASMMAFLPPEKMAHRQTWRNPWKRSYSKHRKAYWEVYDDLCEKVKKRAPYNKGRRLLDIVDMSVMDFMMGNLDRHHYETFRAFGNDSFIIHLDHGRGFGKAHQDEMSCLAPMLQCCMLRRSTLQRLVRLYRGPYPFSAIVRAALSRDSVNPVLIEPHLEALDRRLVKVLRVLAECAGEEGRTLRDVVVDDGVY